jgi:hypothetical protein
MRQVVMTKPGEIAVENRDDPTIIATARWTSGARSKSC